MEQRFWKIDPLKNNQHGLILPFRRQENQCDSLLSKKEAIQ